MSTTNNNGSESSSPKSIQDGTCPKCDAPQEGDPIPEHKQGMYGNQTHFSKTVLVEYSYGHPARYDGYSELMCWVCGYREGRWSGRELIGDDYELRYGGQHNVITMPNTSSGFRTNPVEKRGGPSAA